MNKFVFYWVLMLSSLSAFGQSLKEKAEAGDMDSQYRYALSLSADDATVSSSENNENQAFVWFLKAAEQGHAQAQNNVGFRYYYGKGVSQNYEKAFYWYNEAGKQGEKTAIYNTGVCYEYGRGVLKSLSNAFDCYKRSSELGYEPGKRSLASCYKDGTGVTQDYTKAAQLYGELSDNGDTDAQYELAKMYLRGNGVEKDTIAAVELLLSSAGGGSSSVHDSRYIKEDANEYARSKLLEISKNSSSKYAYFIYAIVGCLYEAEGEFAQAELYYKKAIESHGALGTIRLALMYFYLIANCEENQPINDDEYYEVGLGLESYGYDESLQVKANSYYSTKTWNNDECVKWLENAIKYNHGSFTFGMMGYSLYDHLLFCYYDGIGSLKDLPKAIDVAYKSLGDKNIESFSISRYLSEAVLKASIENIDYSNIAYGKYVDLYELLKNPESNFSSEIMRVALSGLGKAKYKGLGTNRNYDDAFKYLSMAADLGDSESMRLLSACYRYGRGVTRDSVKEKEWLDKAVKKRDDKAVELYERLMKKSR